MFINKLLRISRLILAVSVATLLSACSTPQVNLSAVLSPVVSPGPVYVLESNTTVSAPRAKSTILKEGTRWQQVGTIEQGTVYHTTDQVVIVNSFNVHEGDIVISDNKVVGYYLTVEGTFVESTPTQINLVEEEI